MLDMCVISKCEIVGITLSNAVNNDFLTITIKYNLLKKLFGMIASRYVSI